MVQQKLAALTRELASLKEVKEVDSEPSGTGSATHLQLEVSASKSVVVGSALGDALATRHSAASRKLKPVRATKLLGVPFGGGKAFAAADVPQELQLLDLETLGSRLPPPREKTISLDDDERDTP